MLCLHPNSTSHGRKASFCYSHYCGSQQALNTSVHCSLCSQWGLLYWGSLWPAKCWEWGPERAGRGRAGAAKVSDGALVGVSAISMSVPCLICLPHFTCRTSEMCGPKPDCTDVHQALPPRP